MSLPRWALVIVPVTLGFLALLALWALRAPPLPVPVPAAIDTLDPQVRDHLAQLAVHAGNAPADPGRRVELGLAFAVNDLWPEARQCFLHAIALGEKGPLPAFYAAVARQELGEPDAAVRELQQLVSRFPDHAPSWQRLGVMLIAQGQHAEAAQAFENVTRLAPGEWRGWAGLGEARIRSGDAVGAIEPLERALAIDGYARSARHLLGQAYRAAGRTEEAKRELAAGVGQTIGPMPDDWSVRAMAHMKLLPDQFERADGLMARGEADLAIQLLQEAHRFHPENVPVVTRLAEALNAVGRSDDAWRVIEPFLERQPPEVQVLISASQVSAALLRTNEALVHARAALAQAPRLAEAHVAEANALVAIGDDKAAMEALARALELAPNGVGLWIQMGDLQWRNLNQQEAALESYQQARRIDPIHPVALQRLADLYTERGELDLATNVMAELSKLVPQTARSQ